MNVLSLTWGRPVEASDMITTILIRLSHPRGEVMFLEVADEPVVVVKLIANDLHGDMRRGENYEKEPDSRAFGKKTEQVKAKGGTYKETEVF